MNEAKEKYVERNPWRTIFTSTLTSTALLAIGMCLPSIYRFLNDPPIYVDNFVIASSAVNLFSGVNHGDVSKIARQAVRTACHTAGI